MDASDLDLLIVTSVTGLAVPSLDARLIPRLGLRPDIKRMPIFGLGCVAGAAGLARLHDYLLAWPRHTAALLAVELCSLTVPTARATTADLVVSGLFGDGAAALVARGEQASRRVRRPAGHRHPQRGISRHRGCAGLAADVGGLPHRAHRRPGHVVAKHLGAGVSDFPRQHGLTVGDIRSWVCHPGGPKVIDAIQQSFGLPDSALEVTRRSLAGSRQHVLGLGAARAPADDRYPPAAARFARLADRPGPGVSVELVLLELVAAAPAPPEVVEIYFGLLVVICFERLADWWCRSGTLPRAWAAEGRVRPGPLPGHGDPARRAAGRLLPRADRAAPHIHPGPGLADVRAGHRQRNALRWWCIAALGPRWSARVIVMPGAPLVRTGPYR